MTFSLTISNSPRNTFNGINRQDSSYLRFTNYALSHNSDYMYLTVYYLTRICSFKGITLFKYIENDMQMHQMRYPYIMNKQKGQCSCSEKLLP